MSSEITAQRASEYNIEPQGEKESDAVFRDRVSGRLRDMGRIIEAHEAQTNMLHNDPSGDPMVGIMGALAQKLQDRDYHVRGSSQVDCDISAGHFVRNPRRGSLGGISPDLAIVFATMFGGR